MKTIHFAFRWPVKQTGPADIAVEIPTGGSMQILSERFVEEMKLSEKEIESAETEVLKAVAIIQ